MYSSSSALRLLRESSETGEKQNGAITTQEVVLFVGMECTYSPTRTRTVVSLEPAHGHCNFASAVDRLLCGRATIFPLTKYIVLLILVAKTACLPACLLSATVISFTRLNQPMYYDEPLPLPSCLLHRSDLQRHQIDSLIC